MKNLNLKENTIKVWCEALFHFNWKLDFALFAITKLSKKYNGPSRSNWWCIFSCALFIFIFDFFTHTNK
jgi:hypothetical protein